MPPEILDADLTSLVLTSCAWGATRREDLPWMTMPPLASWDRARNLLKSLGALDDDGALTEKGRRMSDMPMHPRLANMLLGGGDPILAATIEEGGRSRESDIRYVEKTSRILELSRRFEHFCTKKPAQPQMGEGAMLALAYPERIAKNRGNGTFRMVSGRGAALDRDDPLASEPYIVACKLDDRTGDARIFLACPISEPEILSLYGDKIAETVCCRWDRRTEAVKNVVQGALGEMVIYEKPAKDAANCERAMLEGVRQKGVENLPCWTKESLQLKARINFLYRSLGAAGGWPQITDEAVISALEGFIGGIKRWKELENVDMTAVLDFIVAEAGKDRRALDRLAPGKMEVPSGSRMTIHYDGDEPTVEVRLQECFGMVETPRVADGSVAVVMTLLSPAMRPIQVTKDLAGFWRGAYQLVRKDMRGRYPKHYWPEDPLTAVATRRVRPQAGGR
jgi:ATP-dependent helicase HrpB